MIIERDQDIDKVRLRAQAINIFHYCRFVLCVTSVSETDCFRSHNSILVKLSCVCIIILFYILHNYFCLRHCFVVGYVMLNGSASFSSFRSHRRVLAFFYRKNPLTTLKLNRTCFVIGSVECNSAVQLSCSQVFKQVCNQPRWSLQATNSRNNYLTLIEALITT